MHLNICNNSLIYADDSTLTAESKKELESPDEGEGVERKRWVKATLKKKKS